ncbi:MAG TPA: hypothetical protein VF705_14865 [Longimicrobium sp.]
MARATLSHVLVMIGVCAVLPACATMHAGAAHTDARACRAVLGSSASPLQRAVACAEEFVHRNGYTDAPPAADSSLVATESIEWSGSLAELLASRRNTLEAQAFSVCTFGDEGYAVVFRFRGGSADHGRVVTMSPRFGGLRVEHQDFALSNVTERRVGCAPIAAGRDP